MKHHHDKLRSTRLLSYAIIATVSIHNSFYTSITSAQEIDTIKNLMDAIMAKLCFTPCDNGYTGNEVIPGTKCQWYHYCSAGERKGIIECGDGLWYDPANDYCDAQPQGGSIACPTDPQCPSTPMPTESPVTPSPPEGNPSMSPEERTKTEKPTEKPAEKLTEKPTVAISPVPHPLTPDSLPQTSEPISAAPTIGTAIAHITSK